MGVNGGDKLVVHVLGVTGISAAGEGAARVPVVGAKPRQILGMLAVRLGEPLPKEELAERLWDGRPPRSYVATLESYVCVLRRQLGVDAGRKALATAFRGYLLDPEQVDVDVALVRAHLTASQDARPSELVAGTERALAQVGGTLLASEPYATWAQDERRRFGEQLVSRCVTAAAAAQALGRPDVAERLATRAIDIDPLTEDAWLARMRSLAATSRRLQALRSYSDLRRLLRDELGVEPGAEARALYLSLLRDEPEESAFDPALEVGALLGLLRRALEAVPGVCVPAEDRRLSAVAAELVGAA